MSDVVRLALFNVGVACAGGIALVVVGVPRRRAWLPTLVGLAPATGIALVGTVTALGAMVGIDVGLLAAATLTAGALVVAAALLRGRGAVGSLAPRRSGQSGRLVELAFLLLLAGLSLAIVRLGAATSLAVWDGWAIWAPKAHALFAEGDVWSPVFENAEYFMQHQEYPIFLPALDALSAEALGRFDPRLIDVEAAVVLVAFGAAVWALLRLVVPPAAAAAVAFALTGSAPLAVNAGANYADAVLAVFTALGLVLLFLWLTRDGTTWLALAALFFGTAAVTKSEGLLFAVAAIVAALVVAPRFERSRRLVGAFALGCLAPAAVWSVVDRLNGPGPDNLDLGRLAEPGVLVERVPPAIDAMAGELATGWPLAVGRPGRDAARRGVHANMARSRVRPGMGGSLVRSPRRRLRLLHKPDRLAPRDVGRPCRLLDRAGCRDGGTHPRRACRRGRRRGCRRAARPGRDRTAAGIGSGIVAPEYSFVIPVHNERETLEELYRRLADVLDALDGPAEVLFVDDGSTDGSYEVMLELHERDRRVKLLRLSRNFGHQLALTAGLDHASGNAVIAMDADLQDPPEVALELARRWREGYAVVYAVREQRKGETRTKLVTAKLFYRLLGRLTEVEIPGDAGDFRLIDRQALDAMRSMREHNRYLRGMSAWVGFDQTGVGYVRDARHAGTTKYSLRKMLGFGLDGIVSFSNAPLRFTLNVGFVVSALAFVMGVAAIVVKLGGFYAVPGWASIVVVLAFLGGVQLTVLGVMGEYVAQIHQEVKRRPLYLLRDVVGLEDSALGDVAGRTVTPLSRERR